jgi:hypothetical protein
MSVAIISFMAMLLRAAGVRSTAAASVVFHGAGGSPPEGGCGGFGSELPTKL